jgi:hypothetical protein
LTRGKIGKSRKNGKIAKKWQNREKMAEWGDKGQIAKDEAAQFNGSRFDPIL